MSTSLAGKAALITGGSSGIGKATAKAFAAAGARVALVARRQDELDRVCADIGDAAMCFSADVTDEPAITSAVRDAAEAMGGLDVVVNSAGLCMPAKLEDADHEHWRAHLDVNLSGPFYVSREAGVRMAAAGGGTIVNVASEASVMGMGMYVAYCSAKAGLVGMTKALAAELAPKVTVNAICPGPVDTPMLRRELASFGQDGLFEKEKERVPLGRFATPEEVAAGICFLASDAPFATGTTLEIDGGTTAV